MYNTVHCTVLVYLIMQINYFVDNITRDLDTVDK